MIFCGVGFGFLTIMSMMVLPALAVGLFTFVVVVVGVVLCGVTDMDDLGFDVPLTVRIEGSLKDVERVQAALQFFCRVFSLVSAQTSRIGPDGSVWVAWCIGRPTAPRVAMRRRRNLD